MQLSAGFAPDRRRALALQAVVVLAGGLWAALLVLVFANGERLYSLPLIAATLAPALIQAAGNPRLFFLMGAAATACLGLSINFQREVHMGGASSFSLDLVDLFVLPLLAFIVRDRLQGRREGLVMPAPMWWLVGLVALGVLDVVMGPHRKFAAFEVFRMAKCGLLMFVIANECVRERQFRQVAVALAWGLALNIAVSSAQYALKRTLGLQALGEAAPEAILGANLGVYLQADAVYRISGLLGHPNLYAAYLAMLLPILIALLFAQAPPHLRLGFAALAVAGSASLVLTLSRTGWAAFAAAMLCLLAFLYLHPVARGRWRTLKNAMPFALFLGAAAAAGPVITRLTRSDSGALDFRWEWMGIAWKMIQDKPVLGFGLNSFVHQLIDYTPYSVSRMVELFGPIWPVVHNTYMLVWSEQGTLGLVLFMALNLHLLLVAYRNTRVGLSDTVTLLNAGIFAAIVAVMVDGLGSFYLRVPGPARLFWILGGLAVASHVWNVRNRAWRSRPESRGVHA